MLDTIGGRTVKSLASESGHAAGCGQTGKAILYGALTVGDIALEAFTWSRAGALKGALKGTKAAGTEFSHWIPTRMGGPRAWWNGRVVSEAEHALNDDFRWQFLPREAKTALKPLKDRYFPLRQQLNRLPEWPRLLIFAGGTAVINSGRGGCP